MKCPKCGKTLKIIHTTSKDKMHTDAHYGHTYYLGDLFKVNKVFCDYSLKIEPQKANQI
uniref:Uncharacterized protein n=1 Tax=viral metagenome TaxID=1070528 RepID=A0A6M3KZ77_9ZZZZ